MTTWSQIVQAVQLALGPGGERARSALMTCWESTTDHDAAQRCVLAHYLADVQDDLDDEIAWDEEALAAHADVADADLVPLGISSAAGFAPSLHLNLGDGYRRARRLDDARTQVSAGLAAAGALPDGGYGATIRAGLERLRDRLDEQT